MSTLRCSDGGAQICRESPGLGPGQARAGLWTGPPLHLFAGGDGSKSGSLSTPTLQRAVGRVAC